MKSRVNDFSHGELKARIKSLGISIARYGPSIAGVFERLASHSHRVLYADHVRFDRRSS